MGWLGSVSEIYSHLDGIVKKTGLIFPEQDKSLKTNLKMFKLDNRLI